LSQKLPKQHIKKQISPSNMPNFMLANRENICHFLVQSPLIISCFTNFIYKAKTGKEGVYWMKQLYSTPLLNQ